MPKRSFKETLETFLNYLAFLGFAALVALAIYWFVQHRPAAKTEAGTPENTGDTVTTGTITPAPASLLQGQKPSAHLKAVMEANLPPLLRPLDGKAISPNAALAEVEKTIASRRNIPNAWQPAWITADKLCQTIRQGYVRRAQLTSKLSTNIKPTPAAGSMKIAPLDPEQEKERDAFFDDNTKRQWKEDTVQIQATIGQLYQEMIAGEARAAKGAAAHP